jgi:phage terminase large subunit
MLVEDAISQHIRAACLREVQNSIKDSVKQLIEDKIRAFGQEKAFTITDQEIRGPNDSLFIFRGLQNHTATSIKSLEGFNRALVEEAQTISQRSLDILTPTFRTGSELWFAWNPLDAKDPVDRLFRENQGDPDFVLVTANFSDNPWFPVELRGDMERDRKRDPEKYAHIWLGEYQRTSQARVFHNWKVEEFESPSDARFYYGADWGFSVDPTVLVRCWIKDRTLYVDQEAWQVGCEIDKTPATVRPRWPGSRRWPITADSSDPQSISYMARHGFPNIKPSVKGPGSVEEGVEFLKGYDIIVHPRCKHVLDELATYSYEVDKQTGDVLPKLADKKNHTIDSLRYAVEGVRRAPPMPVFGRYGTN